MDLLCSENIVIQNQKGYNYETSHNDITVINFIYKL